MAAAVFGTFLTTFAVVLTNHLPGAVCAMVALYAAVRIWFDGDRRLRYFVLVGLFGAMLVGRRVARGGRWRRPWAWRCSGRPRGRRCWPGCRRRCWWPPDSSAPTGWPFRASCPAYMHRSRPTADNWYRLHIRAQRQEGGKLLEQSAGHGRRRAVAWRVCLPRPAGPPRHLLAHARLAAERRRHAGLAVSAAATGGCATWRY